MDVATLIERVANQSLSGSASGDADATAMILGWIQSAYDEVWSQVATEFPTLLETTQSVTVTAGIGTLSPWPMSIGSVYDTTNKTFLTVTSFAEAEEADPELDNTGIADRYYVTQGTQLNLNAKSDIVARVRYVPFAGTLIGNGVESSIRIPPQYHDVLEWGALRYAAYDERDKGVAIELQATQTMFDKRLKDFLEWLRIHQPQPEARVQGYLG